MDSDSVCYECKHCCSEEITDGYDALECEECMNNFGMSEGCYHYEQRKIDLDKW